MKLLIGSFEVEPLLAHWIQAVAPPLDNWTQEVAPLLDLRTIDQVRNKLDQGKYY